MVLTSIAQLTAGNLTARILAEMDTAPAKKLVVWSGHSETLWSFLSAVGVNVTGYPPFACAMASTSMTRQWLALPLTHPTPQ